MGRPFVPMQVAFEPSPTKGPICKVEAREAAHHLLLRPFLDRRPDIDERQLSSGANATFVYQNALLRLAHSNFPAFQLYEHDSDSGISTAYRRDGSIGRHFVPLRLWEEESTCIFLFKWERMCDLVCNHATLLERCTT